MLARFKMLALVVLAAGLGACQSQIVPATSHAPSVASEIKIYSQAPMKYERLGLVTHAVTATTQWKENADADAVFNDLLEKAAAMGANGLLLKDDTGSFGIMVGANFKGSYFLVPLQREPKTVIAQAIFKVD